MTYAGLPPGKLRWRCRRGMKELDELLLAYLEHRYPGATEAEKSAFEALLELQDPQIHGYLLGRDRPDDPAVRDVVREIAAA